MSQNGSVVNKDLTTKAKANDSKFVLKNTSEPMIQAKDNNTAKCTGDTSLEKIS